VTRYAYDLDDRLTSTTDPVGRVTTLGYDALGRPAQVSNAAIQSAPLVQRAYTADGLTASLTIARNNTTFSTTSLAYDGLATTTYPDTSTETLGYDADGNVLTRLTRASQTITFTYDTLNRLSTKAAPSEATVTYAYDLAGRFTGASDTSAAMTVAATPSGTLATASIGYDQMNRPLSFVFGPAPAQTTPSAGSSGFAYLYDLTNRRIGGTATDNSWWAYPATASTVAYTANSLDQYSAVGAVTPIYDGNGSLTFDGTFTYHYDAESRLTSVTQGATTVATYAYDALGHRKSKTVGATTTIYVSDAANRAVLDYDGSGAVQRWYAFGAGPNEALGQMNVAASTRATFIPDVQGSVVGSLDSSSGAIAKAGYQAYGESGSTGGTFRYTGARIDAETNGLYDFRARMYSPVLGRFLQADPIGTQGGNNLYAYVGNDPLNNSDPHGNCPWCIGAVSSVILGGAIRGVTGGEIFDVQAIAFDAATGAIGAGIISKATELYQVSRAGAGLARAGYLGDLGEEALGLSGPKQAISIGSQVRVPDSIIGDVIQESKNVATIGSRDAAQISDYAAYAANPTTDINSVQVFTRATTDVARIQGLIDSGAVEQGFLPNIGANGFRTLSASESATIGIAIGGVNSSFTGANSAK
jgi:RHS repeat-associated protein